MSDYLIQQLGAHGNIDVLLNSEIAEARGDGQLHSVLLRNRADDSTVEVDAQGVFILIGAMPRTDWLPPAIARDERGFVLTGEETSPSVDGDPPWRALETTMPGVFTAGDVRRGSVKRVAAAVGEGATAIRLIHDYLSATRAES
jgi:thioredoxin reductase (NADPH)